MGISDFGKNTPIGHILNYKGQEVSIQEFNNEKKRVILYQNSILILYPWTNSTQKGKHKGFCLTKFISYRDIICFYFFGEMAL